MLKKIILLLTISIMSVGISFSQEIIDQVIAVVGNEIILESEIENQYIQLMSQEYYSNSEDLKCDILEEMMFQKLLFIQAGLDSVEITKKEVETELDRLLGKNLKNFMESLFWK